MSYGSFDDDYDDRSGQELLDELRAEDRDDGEWVEPEALVGELRRQVGYLDDGLLDVRRCFRCGCTDKRACETPGGPCFWVAADLCSGCYERGDRLTDEVPLLYGPNGEVLKTA
jgi:hypothetical protein